MSINFRKITSKIWDNIDKKGDPASGYKGTYVTSNHSKQSKILIFIDEKSNLHLVIGVENFSEENISDPQVNGLTLKLVKYRFESLGVHQFIDLECTHRAYKDEFTEIIKEISEKILLDNELPTSAVVEVINNWKSFWGKRPKEILSDEEQIGLLCELKVLRCLCHSNRSKALESWKGPLGEEHDFVLSNKHLEIKGTRKDGRVHIINGIDQLKIPVEKKLFFVSYLASKTENESSISLPELITEIEKKELGNKPALIQKFRDLLAYTGYNPAHRKEYEKAKFDIYDGQVFNVDNNFPNLTSNNLKEPLNSRITEVNYKIELQGIPSKSVMNYNWEE